MIQKAQIEKLDLENWGEFTHKFQVPNVTQGKKVDRLLNFKAKYNVTCNAAPEWFYFGDNKIQCGKINLDFNTLSTEVFTANYNATGSLTNYLVKPQSYSITQDKSKITATLNSKYQTELDPLKSFSASDLIMLDPTYTLTNVSFAGAVKNNVDCEGGNSYCHLAVNDTKLVLYMPFDVNVSPTTGPDWSSYNNDFTYGAGTFLDNYGKYGSSGRFLGGSGNVMSRNAIWFDKFTIAFWVNMSAIGTNDNFMGEYDGVAGWLFRTGTPDASVLEFYSGTTAYDTLANNLATGRWIHVAVTYNDSTAYNLYVNGTLAYSSASGQGAAVHRATANIFKIGGVPVAGYEFNGNLDELMIFNRSLSAGEISKIYNGTFPRFKSVGNMSLNLSIAIGDNRVNVTTQTQNQQNSTGDFTNISLAVWNNGDDSWTNYINITNLGNHTFNIDNTATSINLSYMFIPDYNSFFSPILLNNITIVNWTSGGADTTPPNVEVVDPTNKNYTTSPILFNITNNEDVFSCNFSFDNFLYNYSMDKVTTQKWTAINDTIADGYYLINYTCRDIIGNENSTAFAIFWVNTTMTQNIIENPIDNMLLDFNSLSKNNMNIPTTSDFTFSDIIGKKLSSFLFNIDNFNINVLIYKFANIFSLTSDNIIISETTNIISSLSRRISDLLSFSELFSGNSNILKNIIDNNIISVLVSGKSSISKGITSDITFSEIINGRVKGFGLNLDSIIFNLNINKFFVSLKNVITNFNFLEIFNRKLQSNNNADSSITFVDSFNTFWTQVRLSVDSFSVSTGITKSLNSLKTISANTIFNEAFVKIRYYLFSLADIFSFSDFVNYLHSIFVPSAITTQPGSSLIISGGEGMFDLKIDYDKYWYFDDENLIYVTPINITGGEIKSNKISYGISENISSFNNYVKINNTYIITYIIEEQNVSKFNINISVYKDNKVVSGVLNIGISKKTLINKIKNNALSTANNIEYWAKNNPVWIMIIILFILLIIIILVILVFYRKIYKH